MHRLLLATSLLLLSPTARPNTVSAQASGPVAEAQAAIREGRPAAAISLLESVINGNTADSAARLVYVVALLADRRVGDAETKIARLSSDGVATAAQIELLRASLERVKAAQARSRQIAPLIERGDVRGALAALEEGTGGDPGDVFARAYLLRLLGEFDRAIAVLQDAERKSTGAMAKNFRDAARVVEIQHAAFDAAKRGFEWAAFGDFEFPPHEVGCGRRARRYDPSSAAYAACLRDFFQGASRAAQAVFEIAPYSPAGISARLAQAIWLGKDADAVELVSRSRRNGSTLAIPSWVKPNDSVAGYLVCHFDTRELEWVDWKLTAPWLDDPTRSTAFFVGAYLPEPRHLRDAKDAKAPRDGARVPFARVKSFSQELDILAPDYPVAMKAVAVRTDAGHLGGVAGKDFALAFGEVPFRLAMRTYGRVVAECLSLPQNKYSLVGEKPGGGSGGLLSLVYAAVAGVAAAQGNTAVMSNALQSGAAARQQYADTTGANESAREAWQREMQSVELSVDARAIQVEVASLLDGSLVPSNTSNPLGPGNPESAAAQFTGRWSATGRHSLDDGWSQDETWFLELKPGGEGMVGTLVELSTFNGPNGSDNYTRDLVALLSVSLSGPKPTARIVSGWQNRIFSMGSAGLSLTQFELGSAEVSVGLRYEGKTGSSIEYHGDVAVRMTRQLR